MRISLPVLGIEPRACHMPGKYAITKLHPLPNERTELRLSSERNSWKCLWKGPKSHDYIWGFISCLCVCAHTHTSTHIVFINMGFTVSSSAGGLCSIHTLLRFAAPSSQILEHHSLPNAGKCTALAASSPKISLPPASLSPLHPLPSSTHLLSLCTWLHLHPSLPAPFPHRTSESETACFIHSYHRC